ncbi:MAG: hypothetical protein EBT92_19055 [Planctomycetes bacterium]|jgi:hypothetical protein|nr:hypothetical protein [Planctomycetota bacterium]
MGDEMPIRFDRHSGAYSDGKRFVKAAVIRKFTIEKLGKPQVRGRLKVSDIEAYWLHTYAVADYVE